MKISTSNVKYTTTMQKYFKPFNVSIVHNNNNKSRHTMLILQFYKHKHKNKI